jgi:SAM-dependent methyltransferase
MRSTGPMGVLKDTAKKAFPDAYAGYLRWRYKRIPLANRVGPILMSTTVPATYDDEFDTLQNSHAKWWDDYRYDRYSTWARGRERVSKLLTLAPELRALKELATFEAGCGDGMTSSALASYIGEGGRVILNDTDDWRDERARSFPFVKGDICAELPLPSESFDLAVTYNTFEHVSDPQAALRELVRVCKKGAYILIDFAPLFCSALGLHAFSFRMPYPQFLFSTTMIEQKVKELGVEDLGQTHDSLQTTNRWRIAQFRDLWHSSGCDVVSLTEEVDDRHLGLVTQYPNAFSGRGLTLDDLLVWGVVILLRKR